MAFITRFIFSLMLIIPFGAGAEWEGLLGKFTKCIFCKEGFYDLPFTKSEALKSSPPFIDTGVVDPDFKVNIFCLKDDPHVCPLFDKNGNVAGLRISHLKDEIADNSTTFPYKYDEISVFTSANFLGKDLWYTTFLFTKPENLKEGGPGRVSTKESAEGLWVKMDSGWIEVPRDECATKALGWKKQGFIPWMGNHYTVGPTDDCSKFIPYLPIYHKGRLIALSFAPLGKHSVVQRDWFEDVPYDVLKKIIPDGYQPCLEDWTKTYKASSFHFYFIKHPRFILWDQSATC